MSQIPPVVQSESATMGQLTACLHRLVGEVKEIKSDLKIMKIRKMHSAVSYDHAGKVLIVQCVHNIVLHVAAYTCISMCNAGSSGKCGKWQV